MTCRACLAETQQALTLGPQVPANRFIPEADLGKPEPKFDLTVMLCPECGLSQLRTLVPPEELFVHYRYRHGASPSLRKHLTSIASRYGGPGKQVVEIGSNDGALISRFKGTGSSVCGIDPARNLAAIANAEGLLTLCQFFGRDTDLGAKADVIVARNVIAHCPDTDGFLEGVVRNLKPDGVFVVESPWIVSMFECADVNQIYHEHGIYLGIASFQRLLDRHGLHITDARKVDLHGGSLLYEIRREAHPKMAEVIAYEEREWRMGCYNLTGWADMMEDAEEARDQFVKRLKKVRGNVAGYAASAKGMVLLQWAGIGPDLLPMIADETALKQGLYSPGTHIPVVHPERIVETGASWLAILAHNWYDEIRARPDLARYSMFTTDGRSDER